MLVFLQNSSEAGLAKRLRLANVLNSDKRVLYFYGLGLGLSTNAYNQNQYKFELMLLARYCETFSTYTMRRFMEEYMTVQSSVTDEAQRLSLHKMQSEFSVTSVKVLLVSLLNGKLQLEGEFMRVYHRKYEQSNRIQFFHTAFRDLTLMGVQGEYSFD